MRDYDNEEACLEAQYEMDAMWRMAEHADYATDEERATAWARCAGAEADRMKRFF